MYKKFFCCGYLLEVSYVFIKLRNLFHFFCFSVSVNTFVLGYPVALDQKSKKSTDLTVQL